MVGDGVPAADSTAETQQSVLSARRGLSPSDIELLAVNDKCYKRLKAKRDQLKKEPPVSYQEKLLKWKALQKAYSEWAELEHAPLRRLKKIEDLEAEMRRRKITLAEIATRNMIFKIKFQITDRFHVKRENHSADCQTKKSPKPSVSPAETITSPPSG